MDEARTGGYEHTQACAGVVGYRKQQQQRSGSPVFLSFKCRFVALSHENGALRVLRSQLRCPRSMVSGRQRWPNRPLNMWQHNSRER